MAMNAISGMDEIKVKRDDLLVALKENLTTHRTTFIEAQEGYREEVIKELDNMLAGARKGDKIVRSVTWPEPKDHSSDYERAIRMLTMCTDEIVKITDHDFQQLVMDDWGWKANWSATTANYIGNKPT